MKYSPDQYWVLDVQFPNSRHASCESQSQSQKKNDEISSLAKMLLFHQGQQILAGEVDLPVLV